MSCRGKNTFAIVTNLEQPHSPLKNDVNESVRCPMSNLYSSTQELRGGKSVSICDVKNIYNNPV
jgi:hypothetical protein